MAVRTTKRSFAVFRTWMGHILRRLGFNAQGPALLFGVEEGCMATVGRGTIWSAGLLLLLIPMTAPALQEEGEEKEAAMERIRARLDEQKWKNAIKEIKSYRRKHAKTDEEKEEVAGLMALAEGHQDLEKIEKDYRKKRKPRKTSRNLAKFLREYSDVPVLVEKGEELLEVARSEYVLVLEDFEDWKAGDGDDDGKKRERMTVVDDPKFVKHGRKACRWNSGKGWDYWSIESPQPDWSEYDYFCAWIYNEKVGPRPGRIDIEPTVGGYHYFRTFLVIDWVGWKEIRIPLTGRASMFGRHGNPDWTSIERVDFDHDDYYGGGTAIDIIIDDIRLEKAVK